MYAPSSRISDDNRICLTFTVALGGQNSSETHCLPCFACHRYWWFGHLVTFETSIALLFGEIALRRKPDTHSHSQSSLRTGPGPFQWRSNPRKQVGWLSFETFGSVFLSERRKLHCWPSWSQPLLYIHKRLLDLQIQPEKISTGAT